MKTPVNGLLDKKFQFGPLFRHHNFQNQINTWETTVHSRFFDLFVLLILKSTNGLAVEMEMIKIE